MESQVTWYALYIAVTVIVTLGTGVAGVVAWLWNQMSKLKSDLDEHRVQVAETYVTTVTLSKVEERLTVAINRMADQIARSMESITDRMEDLFREMLRGDATIARRKRKD